MLAATPDPAASVARNRNLSHAEAVERTRLLDVRSYDIAIDLTDGSGHPGEGTFRTSTAEQVASYHQASAARTRSWAAPDAAQEREGSMTAVGQSSLLAPCSSASRNRND